jgi:tRNA A-37 threonylcarbamoyl transferase component Bud32
LGEVYDARDHEQARDVGLMVLPADFAGDPARRERFLHDAGAAALLEHPHILTVYNVGADARAGYVISEPILGRTLREVLAGGPIPPGAGAPFVPQIAEALAAAHEKGIVHGNLTPDSILFTANGVKVIGFGLSAAAGLGEATAAADLAAFDAITEKLGGPRVEERSGWGWSGVAATVGILACAALIGLWLTFARTQPSSRLKPAPTTPEVMAAPTTPEIEPAPTTPAAKPTLTPPAAKPARRTTDRPPSQLTPAPTTELRKPAPTIAEAAASAKTASVPPGSLLWRPSRLVWLTGDGTEAGTLVQGEDYGHVSLSPDATHVAVSIREADGVGGDIWIIDAGSGARRQLTAGVADDIAPLWSPDGSRVAYASWRDRAYDIFEKASDGAGLETVIVSAPGEQIASDWTPSRNFVLYQTDQPGATRGANLDLWARSWPPRGRPFAFLRTVHAASHPSSSPDGRWVAFTLFGKGAEDVYVARFPHYEGRRRISPAGGSWPRWRGNAIFYVDTQGRLVSMPIAISGDGIVVPGVPMILSQVFLKPDRGYPYDVAADGQRILINVAVAGAVTAGD